FGKESNACSPTGVAYNEVAWAIAINESATQADTPFRNAFPTQVFFTQFAGSRNLIRVHWDGTQGGVDSVPGLPEPIATQRDYVPGFTPHVEGSINPDLSAIITVFYNDGLAPPSTTYIFPAVQGAVVPPPGPMLALGNNSCNPGIFLLDNLDVRGAS